MKLNRIVLIIALAVILPASSAFAAEVALDYDSYKSRVEPIFLKKRPSHGRCYVCHAESNNAFRLEKLSPGSTSWTEEQSQRNFEKIAALVVAGAPDKSKLLLQPLAPEGVDSPITPAADNLLPRTTLTGRSSPNGRADNASSVGKWREKKPATALNSLPSPVEGENCA